MGERFGVVSHRILRKLRLVASWMPERIVKIVPVFGDNVCGRGRIIKLPRDRVNILSSLLLASEP
jgi:hypothetical protein